MHIKPQTIENELIQEANKLGNAGPYFVDPKDPEWRRLVAEAEKLRAVERWAGWSILGSLHGLIGDVAGMNRAFETSLSWLRDPTTISNWIGNLVHVGHFSAAQKLFSEEAEPRKGIFSYLSDVGMASCAYQRVAEYLELAKELNMELGAVNAGFVSSVSGFLSEIGLSDAEVVKHLDVAGEILRNRRIAVKIKTELRRVPGIQNGITVAVEVPVSQSEAFDMNMELAMAEEKFEIKKHPAFDIVFAAI